MRIVFMGTPSFAVPTLEGLIASGHEVVAVYSKPPKPSGRGQELLKAPVHVLAEKCGVPVFTPSSLKPIEQINQLQLLAPDVIVVAAYGIILRSEVLSIPKFGCINIHPSDLPRWRGASPIQRTILAGDTKTSMCIMKMDEGLDTGDVIIRHNIELDPQVTAHQLHNQMASLGAELLLQALALIADGTATYCPQAEDGATYAAKLESADEKLDFNRSAYLVNCQVRALSPKPGAYFNYQGESLKVISAEYSMEAHEYQPGTVIGDRLHIACKEGFLQPTLVQRPGRKMIYTDAFLRGYPIPSGSILL